MTIKRLPKSKLIWYSATIENLTVGYWVYVELLARSKKQAKDRLENLSNFPNGHAIVIRNLQRI